MPHNKPESKYLFQIMYLRTMQHWFMKYCSNICIYTLKDKVTAVLPGVKGQLISKANCQAVNSSKNEQMNSFLLVCDVFSFLFWKKLRTPKRHFEIIRLLVVFTHLL